MLQQVLLIALAGGLGTLGRFGIGQAAIAVVGSQTHWGTAVANALGCFLFGAVWGLGEARHCFSPETRQILLVGFMGGLTTFSSFIFDSGDFFLAKEAPLSGLLNLGGQVLFGLLAMAAGIALVRSTCSAL